MTEAPPSTMNEKTAVSAFSEFLPLIRAADGLTLGQVCTVTTLEPSTIQNWIKRGFVPHPIAKKYRERHIARILLINALRDSMPIDRVGALMTYINGNADDESDDIISDVDLYDIFSKVTEEIGKDAVANESAGERVEQILNGFMSSSPERERLARALTIMATAHVAGIYKKQADRLYMDLVKEENHE